MKILLIKLGARGDVLRTTGILPALKDKYPDSQVWWLADETSLPILERNPDIRKIITNRNCLKDQKFDLVINLEESSDAARLASDIGGEKFGFLYNGGIYPTPTAEKLWRMSIHGPKPENDILKKNNTQTYQELLKEMLDLPGQISRPVFPATEAEKSEKLIGINFGSGKRWKTKRLPVKKVEEIIKNKKFKFIIFGGKDEKKDIAFLKTRYPEIMFADALPINGFSDSIKSCSVLITTDTLALHLALAVGTKVLALFGPTSAAEIELFGSGEKLTASMPCVCCYKKECRAVPFCMDSFDSGKIITQAIRIAQSE
jgi:heptosyltransferase-2